jgi:hypothetical protein
VGVISGWDPGILVAEFRHNLQEWVFDLVFWKVSKRWDFRSVDVNCVHSEDDDRMSDPD